MSRTEQMREAKQRQREREAKAGIITISVKLTPSQFDIYSAALTKQRGPLLSFAQRCLTTGATFLANAGTPRGKKLGVQP